MLHKSPEFVTLNVPSLPQHKVRTLTLNSNPSPGLPGVADEQRDGEPFVSHALHAAHAAHARHALQHRRYALLRRRDQLRHPLTTVRTFRPVAQSLPGE